MIFKAQGRYSSKLEQIIDSLPPKKIQASTMLRFVYDGKVIVIYYY